MKRVGSWLAFVLAAVLLAGLLAGCGAQTAQSGAGQTAADGTEDLNEPVLTMPAVESAFEETVLVDNDDIAVTVTGFDPVSENCQTFTVLLENKTDQNLCFSWDKCSINGVMVQVYLKEEVRAGKSVSVDQLWGAPYLIPRGINYIEDVECVLRVYDPDTRDNVYKDTVSWSVSVSGTDLPPTQPVEFDHGFDEIELVNGDVTAVIKDYDPQGNYDGGPSLVLYVENNTDTTIWFEVDDAAFDGVERDTYGGAEAVFPGAVAYSYCSWLKQDLEEASVDEAEALTFDFIVKDDDSRELLADVLVTMDATGGELRDTTGPATVAKIAPAVGSLEGVASAVDENEPVDVNELLELVSKDGIAAYVAAFADEGEGSASLTLYLENDTDMDLTFFAFDVYVNGEPYDPWWIEDMAAGTTGYSEISWDASTSDLMNELMSELLGDMGYEMSSAPEIDTFETIEFTLYALDNATEETQLSVSISLEV